MFFVYDTETKFVIVAKPKSKTTRKVQDWNWIAKSNRITAKHRTTVQIFFMVQVLARKTRVSNPNIILTFELSGCLNFHFEASLEANYSNRITPIWVINNTLLSNWILFKLNTNSLPKIYQKYLHHSELVHLCWCGNYKIFSKKNSCGRKKCGMKKYRNFKFRLVIKRFQRIVWTFVT